MSKRFRDLAICILASVVCFFTGIALNIGQVQMGLGLWLWGTLTGIAAVHYMQQEAQKSPSRHKDSWGQGAPSLREEDGTRRVGEDDEPR